MGDKSHGTFGITEFSAFGKELLKKKGLLHIYKVKLVYVKSPLYLSKAYSGVFRS